MTVHKARNIYICRSRVPLPKIYSSISEVSHPAYASETETSDVEVAPVLGGVEVGWIVALPVPGNLGSWVVFERNGCRVVIPGVWFGNNNHDSMQRLGS